MNPSLLDQWQILYSLGQWFTDYNEIFKNNQISALNNSSGVDMPFNKKKQQPTLSSSLSLMHIICSHQVSKTITITTTYIKSTTMDVFAYLYQVSITTTTTTTIITVFKCFYQVFLITTTTTTNADAFASLHQMSITNTSSSSLSSSFIYLHISNHHHHHHDDFQYHSHICMFLPGIYDYPGN